MKTMDLDDLGALFMGAPAGREPRNESVDISKLVKKFQAARPATPAGAPAPPPLPVLVITDCCRSERGQAWITNPWQTFIGNTRGLPWSPTETAHRLRQAQDRLRAQNTCLLFATQDTYAATEFKWWKKWNFGGHLTRTLFYNARVELERRPAAGAEFDLAHVLFRTLCCAPAFPNKAEWRATPHGQFPMVVGGFGARPADRVVFRSARTVVFDAFKLDPAGPDVASTVERRASNVGADNESEGEFAEGGWEEAYDDDAYLRKLRRDHRRLVRERKELLAKQRAVQGLLRDALAAAGAALALPDLFS